MMLRSMTVAHLTWRAESAAQGIELKLRRPLVPAMLHARQRRRSQMLSPKLFERLKCNSETSIDELISVPSAR